MARSATTSDVFNAVAEPQRRSVLALLASGERSVNDVAEALRLRQPQASKHPSVLKTVGLVRARGGADQPAAVPLEGGPRRPRRLGHEAGPGMRETLERLEAYLASLA